MSFHFAQLFGYNNDVINRLFGKKGLNMFNIRLNIFTGIIGVAYISVDVLYHLVVWSLMHLKKLPYITALRLADNKGLFFTIIVGLTLILSLVSLLALISNLILFTRPDFILRVVFSTAAFFLPFIHREDSLSLLFEIFFIILYLVYLYRIYNHKQEARESEFENYKQM